MQVVKWAYGVTTVPERFSNLLPRTLLSLAAGGFPTPRLFVDGPQGVALPYEITYRNPRIRTYGNWVLGLAELYIRQPDAHLFAMFQDDLVCYRNLRQYLERCCMTLPTATCNSEPKAGVYWNLYTFPQNQGVCPQERGRYKDGWFEACRLNERPPRPVDLPGVWPRQKGLSALALVFSRKGVIDLLTHAHIVERPLDATWGHKKIDGGIVAAMNKAGYLEMVHSPSLVQHTGDTSTMENRPHPKAQEWRGEDYDATSLLNRIGQTANV